MGRKRGCESSGLVARSRLRELRTADKEEAEPVGGRGRTTTLEMLPQPAMW